MSSQESMAEEFDIYREFESDAENVVDKLVMEVGEDHESRIDEDSGEGELEKTDEMKEDAMEDSGVVDGSALEDTSNIEVESETDDVKVQKFAALAKAKPFAPTFTAPKKFCVPGLMAPAPANLAARDVPVAVAVAEKHTVSFASSPDLPRLNCPPAPQPLKDLNKAVGTSKPKTKKQKDLPELTFDAVAAMNRCTARHAQEGVSTAVLDEMAKVQKAVAKVMKARKDIGLEGKPKVKKPPSAYLLFSNEHRVEVREKQPDLRMPEVAKELGKMWNALQADEKQIYFDRAAKLKELAGMATE